MIHSRFGSSRIASVIACAGFNNATLEHDLSPDDLSLDEQSAIEGNCGHMAAEHCLKLGLNMSDVIGQTFNGVVVDEVMAEYITVYTNHVRSLRSKHPNAKSLIEPRLTMSSIAPDVFGYADHLMIADDTLYIDDLKYGFVIVNEEDNPQCAHLAVSALDTFKLWFKIKKVECTIIQPRADHVQGSIRTVKYDIQDLMRWRDTFIEAVKASRQKDAKRTAGTHCKYCPARATCRARMIKTVFTCSLDTPINTVSDDEIANLLREIPSIKSHLEAVEAQATILARSGKTYKDFKLVKSRVRAECNDQDQLKEVVKKAGGCEDDLFYPGKLKGKTMLRPLFKKLNLDINEYFETPEAQTKLVPITHSATAVNRSASGVFKPIKDI